jgi:hypothetical protein
MTHPLTEVREALAKVKSELTGVEAMKAPARAIGCALFDINQALAALDRVIEGGSK